MLKRKIFKQIEHFYKTSKGALLVTGARQIGKTYSVRKFAKSNFKSFVEINFIEFRKIISGGNFGTLSRQKIGADNQLYNDINMISNDLFLSLEKNLKI